MTNVQATAYPHLRNNFTKEELERNFTPTADEIDLMKVNTMVKSPVTQVGFMIILKCYQCLGRPTSIKKVPTIVKEHILKSLSTEPVDNLIPINSLLNYDHSKSRKRHIQVVRKYLKVSADKKARKICMKKIALQSSAIKENLADIINDMLEGLVKESFELPSFTVLRRLARAARKINILKCYRQISGLLTTEAKAFIDKLFIKPSHTETSLWNKLKQDPKNPTSKNIKAFINYLCELRKLKEQLNTSIDFIPIKRIETLVEEALSMDARDMKDMVSNRRYCLAAIFIIFKTASAIDDLVSVFIRWMRKLQTDGKESLRNYYIEQASETDGLIGLLHKILGELKSNTKAAKRIKAIENCITQGIDNAMAQCEQHMAYADDNYFPFMLKPYNNKRFVIFTLLEQLNIKSAYQDTTLLEAMNFIKANQHSRKEWLSPCYCNDKKEEMVLDLNWLSDKWFKLVTGRTKGKSIIQIHCRYYELAVLCTLADDFNCGDVYVDEANAFDDPNKQLMSWEQFYAELDEYCNLTNLPKTSEAFIDNYQKKLHEESCQVDNNFESNKYLTIEKGEPVVKKHSTEETSPEVKKIGKLIADHMPQTNIVEVIADVEKWLNLSAIFKPLSGHESRLENHKDRFVGTSFTYGCNVGPTEAARSLLIFTRKQLAWMFNHQMTEDKMEKASKKLINIYNKFDLPKKWGTGSSVSVDATFWDMHKKNLTAELHIRYGGYGGLGFYHISDLYIALFASFIPCGVYEGAYLFDGINENDSDVKPTTIHGDTGIQSEVIFGFAILLAIELMPRIRDFKHLRFYKASKNKIFTHIEDLFTNESIDWELIKTYYYDMLRLIMSIRTGKIKASTILRKLCSKSRKNKLFFAFRELGRVGRTIFLLKYINDVDLRRTIQAATVKSEEFNDFISWVRFGDGGAVADNMRFNQQKIIKCGQMVANMVMLHVVAHMTKEINLIKNKFGIKIGDKILRHFSPYRVGHINRLGIFKLDANRKPIDLEYGLAKK